MVCRTRTLYVNDLSCVLHRSQRHVHRWSILHIRAERIAYSSAAGPPASFGNSSVWRLAIGRTGCDSVFETVVAAASRRWRVKGPPGASEP